MSGIYKTIALRLCLLLLICFKWVIDKVHKKLVVAFKFSKKKNDVFILRSSRFNPTNADNCKNLNFLDKQLILILTSHSYAVSGLQESTGLFFFKVHSDNLYCKLQRET